MNRTPLCVFKVSDIYEEVRNTCGIEFLSEFMKRGDHVGNVGYGVNLKH